MVLGVAATVAVLILYGWRTMAVEKLLKTQDRAFAEMIKNQREILAILKAGR